MLRAGLLGIALLALGTTASKSQTLPKEWADWLSQNEPQVKKDEQDLASWKAHGAEVCRLKLIGKAKSDCLAQVDKLIGRLTWNKNLLSGVVDALKTLPTDEGIALAFTIVPIYQKSDAETAAISKVLLKKSGE